MSDDKAKIIDRIRKLLALQKSPNENEAAIAAEKAAELLALHNLTLADVRPESKIEEARIDEQALDTLKGSATWRRRLANAVAQVYFCEYFYVTYHKPVERRRKNSKKPAEFTKYDQHNFIGYPHNTAVARMMFEYLADTVERLARESANAHCKNPKEKSPWRVSFRTGCVKALIRRLYERVSKMKAEQTIVLLEDGTKKNLPALQSVFDATSAANAIIKASLGLITKPDRMTVLLAEAEEKGYEAGEEIGFDQQIADRRASQFAITKQ